MVKEDLSLDVLVTGGAGFIGSHLVRSLVGKGWNVVVLDDFSSGRMENFHGLSGSEGLQVVKGDVRDRKVVDEVLDGVDAVVHLAAFVDSVGSVERPLETNDINVNGTLNVLDACVKKGVRRFVFASSAGVYGDGNPLPLREECDLRPVSPYAASKVSGEYYCKVFCDCYGIGTVVLRFFNVYGPGQGANQYAGVITKFVNSGFRGEALTVYGDGFQTRDFINVVDIVGALEKALEFRSSGTGVFNVCTGKPVSINDLACSVGKVLGRDLEVLHVEPRSGDIMHSYGDPGRARSVLGFEARVGFEKGLARYVQCLREFS
jgi:nucleoside-diphosphate-sugar epimerase